MEIQRQECQFWLKISQEGRSWAMFLKWGRRTSEGKKEVEQKPRDWWVCGVAKKQQRDQNSCYLGYVAGVWREKVT